jgi:hypothetical protein
VRARRYLARLIEAGPRAAFRIAGSRLSGYAAYPQAVLGLARNHAGAAHRVPGFCWFWDREQVQWLHSPGGRAWMLAHADAPSTLERAKAYLAGRIALLGWGEVTLGTPVDWSTDAFTRAAWPRKFHKFVDVLQHAGKGDVKVPWELSRHHGLVWLAQAAILTADPRYAQHFRATLRAWCAENPFGIGINWTCSMEVAIRAINIALTANLLDPLLEDSDRAWIASRLREHELHLRLNPEVSDVNGNHWLFDLLGLAILSLVLHGRDSPRTRRAIGRFTQEVLAQFHADGGHIEHATSYHRLATEALVVFSIACERSGVDPGVPFRNVVQDALALLDAIFASPHLPLFGDADSGNLLVLGTQRGNHSRIALSLARHEDCAEGVWGFPGQPALPRVAEREMSIERFADFGLYVIRAAPFHVVIRCGTSGLRGRGSHDHNDQLSIWFAVGDTPLLVDCGTHNYTADAARHLLDLSTARHNTVQVNAAEQAPVVAGSITASVRAATARCTVFELEGRSACFAGVVECYGGQASSLAHERTIRLDVPGDGEACLSVVDRVLDHTGAAVEGIATWMISPRWSESAADHGQPAFESTHWLAKVECDALIAASGSSWSPEYGSEEPALALKSRFSGQRDAP